MLEDLLIHCPENPIDFMMEHLRRNESKMMRHVGKIIMVVGPPGLKLYRIAEDALNLETSLGYRAFNTGEFLVRNKARFSP
jgi:hypothetical protein